MDKKSQKGFTLIELVVVIVIIGILSAVAVPKFIDMSGEAGEAAAKGVAGAVASAAAVNYAARKAGNSSATKVDDCSDATNIIQGGLPSGFASSGGPIVDGAVVSCTITNSNVTPNKTATASVIGVN